MADAIDTEQYRQWIQQLLLERAGRKPTFPEIETQAILDTDRDHYLLLHTGGGATDAPMAVASI
jgi:hypothetical protein